MIRCASALFAMHATPGGHLRAPQICSNPDGTSHRCVDSQKCGGSGKATRQAMSVLAPFLNNEMYCTGLY